MLQKTSQMGVLITSEVLRELNMTAQDFKIELSVHFYDIGKMTLGQARTFAEIDQITFQQELAKRKINIKYEVEDFLDDLKAMESYQKG